MPVASPPALPPITPLEARHILVKGCHSTGGLSWCASAETDEEARFREIMKAQNEVVIELREENERLAAKIAVLEAK